MSVPTMNTGASTETPQAAKQKLRHRKPVLFWFTVAAIVSASLLILVVAALLATASMVSQGSAPVTVTQAPGPEASAPAQPEPSAPAVSPVEQQRIDAEQKIAVFKIVPGYNGSTPMSVDNTPGEIFHYFNQVVDLCHTGHYGDPATTAGITAPAVLDDFSPTGPAYAMWAQCQLFPVDEMTITGTPGNGRYHVLWGGVDASGFATGHSFDLEFKDGRWLITRVQSS